MHSRRVVVIVRWTVAFASLGGIVLVYRRWLHVNPTTVALTLLILILLLAAEWGLSYAIIISITATLCYNFFFLPPIDTFTIADPQNWLALLAFLSTSIIASRLSQRARTRTNEARTRQQELEMLLRLSRELLQTDSAAALLSTIPAAVASITSARAGMLYLLDGDRLYQAGDFENAQRELPHLHQLASTLTKATEDGGVLQIPLLTGVRPKGLVGLQGVTLSAATGEAIGSLVSITIDRAQALEGVARGEAAKESERLRTLVIDSITHELRTPLTSIKGASTALLNGSTMQPQDREFLEIIDEESDRLNKLVSEAVEMAQLDAQQVQMHFAEVSVSDLVANARESCAWVEEQHPLQVDLANGLAVKADPVMLQKVICNLLENAAKYSPTGSPIKVMAESNKNGIAISVADRGIGIESSEQALVFERFYRGRSQTGGTSGTGMGLAISRAITEAHGGQLVLTSQLEHGSVFTIILPTVDGRATPSLMPRKAYSPKTGQRLLDDKSSKIIK